jgi:hypothetical protein
LNYQYTQAVAYLKDKNNQWMERVLTTIRDTSESIIKKSSTVVDAIDTMSSLFDSNQFRIEFGARNEMQRAYNIGIINAGLAAGVKEFTIANIPNDDDGKCEAHGKVNYLLNQIDLDAIPPGYMTHAMCTCTVKLLK